MALSRVAPLLRSRASSTLSGVPERVWNPRVVEPLQRVSQIVGTSLDEIAALRPDVPLWNTAIAAAAGIASAPASYIRPQLVLLGHAAAAGRFSVPGDGVETFAAGAEMQHLFMLVHDDLMDNGTMRRGEQTVPVSLSEADRTLSAEAVASLTIVVGDMLATKSSGLFMSGSMYAQAGGAVDAGGAAGAVGTVLDGAYRAGAAQFDDVLGWPGVAKTIAHRAAVEGGDIERLHATGEADCDELMWRMLSDKAARHVFVAPLVAGAQLGGVTDSVSGRLLTKCCTDWGLHIGSAFQILDDIEDLTAHPLVSGKDVFQDLREGRLSAPLFLLRQQASPQEWAEVKGLLSRQSSLTEPDRRFIVELVERRGVVEAGLDLVQAEINSAERVRVAYLDAEEDKVDTTILGQGLQRFADGLRSHAEDVARNVQHQTLDADEGMH